MIALVHNILPPYRVSLFNAISEQLQGQFHVLLVRETHPGRRRWSVPWQDVKFSHQVLPGWSFDRFGQHLDLSVGIGARLSRLRPDAVVLAGWDLNTSWAALAWCRRHHVPAVAWVESWRHSGRYRGGLSTASRQAFLRGCAAGIVPGGQAADFIKHLVPELATVTMPNSVDGSELRRLPEPKPGVRATFIGELTERKGFDIVLAGRHRILEHFDRMAIAGTGPLEAEAAEIAERDERVELLGFVEGPAMMDLMARTSAVVLPSRRDPWPLVPVEALVAGRPVLLGPGVGSAPDLARLGGGVVTMDDLQLTTVAAGAAELATTRVPADVRTRFTAAESAAAFVSCVEQVKRR